VESKPSDALGPELEEAEQLLESTLTEACASPPASDAETGELIRVDELLEAASDAAKRAISLRRRRRADKSKRADTPAASMGDAEAQASADATHRVFADVRGVRWDVFAVYPEPRPSVHSQLKGSYPQGWLCFDSAGEKRRLSPIPDNWQGLSEEQLAQLAERAESASARRGRGGKASPEQSRPTE
jgi:hypothetical protein